MEIKDKASSNTPAVNTVKVRSCAADTCKGFLYVFNFLFGLSGIGAVIIAARVLRHTLSLDLALIIDTQLYRLGAVIIVLAGCTVTATAFIGSLGVKEENKCFIIAYIVMLIVVFGMVFIAGVFSIAIYTRSENELEFQMLNTLKREFGPGGNEDAQDPITAAWNNLQDTHNCCGVKTNSTNGIIFRSSNWYREQPIVKRVKVPATCCMKNDDAIVDLKSCQGNFGGFEHVYFNGCYDPALRQISFFCSLVSGSVVGITGMQLFALLFSFFVMRQM
ncbi:CD151 antigen-like [Antedon mediterranea]|uniref:CD151 antigen-like n=1 Tax=Antedon mediterranea TaxID=105859 RepID=UPI003AF53D8D